MTIDTPPQSVEVTDFDQQKTEIRALLAGYDSQLVALAAMRARASAPLGPIKHEQGLPIIDEEQRAVALERITKIAIERGLTPEEAALLYNFIHTVSVRMQEEQISKLSE